MMDLHAKLADCKTATAFKAGWLMTDFCDQAFFVSVTTFTASEAFVTLIFALYALTSLRDYFASLFRFRSGGLKYLNVDTFALFAFEVES